MIELNKSAEERLELISRLGDAMNGEDEKEFEAAALAFTEHIHDSVLKEARGEMEGLRSSIDAGILASRGLTALTSEETAYYTKLAEAMKTKALADIDIVMPFTIIDRVFEDLTVTHPLLSVIDFVNTTYLTKWHYNAHETQLAAWGELTGDIVKEITSGFREMDMNLHKLSAFLPISNALLDLGPQWLDRYIRTILSEAMALGVEEAVINGTGNLQPIGMNRSVADNVTVVGGVYPLRASTTLTNFDPVTYGAFLADNLATTANGNPRTLGTILLVCNHQDYLRKILPATTVRTPEGRYVNDVLPFPTQIIQSTRVPAGRAILGLPERYFMGVGMEASGRLEFADEYRFLEDQRVYRIKLYGNGRPMDDVSFTWTDISGLEPLVQQVYVTNMGEAKPDTTP